MTDEELNKEVIIEDIAQIMEHLSNANKEMQLAYIVLAKVVKETIHEQHTEESM